MTQSEEVGGKNPKFKVDSDRLLLVEGKDEVNLLRALMRCRLPDAASEIQVHDAGGKDQFPANLKAIQIAAQTRPTLRSIGVIRDADDNPKGAFQSVCDNLRNAKFTPPDRHGYFSDGVPFVGVFIVPDGDNPGAIETLCRKSVKGSETSDCVEQYLSCLDAKGTLKSKSCDKSFAHAYLAAERDPVARVGEGAKAWDLNSQVFDNLVSFLASRVRERRALR